MLSAQRSVLALTFHVLCKLAVYGLGVRFSPFQGSNHTGVPFVQHEFVRGMVKLAFPPLIEVVGTSLPIGGEYGGISLSKCVSLGQG